MYSPIALGDEEYDFKAFVWHRSKEMGKPSQPEVLLERTFSTSDEPDSASLPGECDILDAGVVALRPRGRRQPSITWPSHDTSTIRGGAQSRNYQANALELAISSDKDLSRLPFFSSDAQWDPSPDIQHPMSNDQSLISRQLALDDVTLFPDMSEVGSGAGEADFSWISMM